jgi:hypothetical protein
MATTTPNFGWSVPTSSDLVKDGATAIETLGDAIDASLLDLKGGTTGQVLTKASNTDMDFSWVADATGIPATIFDAKGDIIAASAADTAARLAVGANGTVLTAASGETTGLIWATPAAASQSWTLLNTGGTSLTGGTVTVSGISGKTDLMIIIDGASQTSGNNAYQLQINTDSGSNYEYFYNVWARAGSFATEYNYIGGGLTSTYCVLGYNGSASYSFSGTILLGNCNSTSRKTIQANVGAGINSGTGAQNTLGQGFYKGSSTVSSISLIVESGTFDAGTVYVYGA